MQGQVVIPPNPQPQIFPTDRSPAEGSSIRRFPSRPYRLQHKASGSGCPPLYFNKIRYSAGKEFPMCFSKAPDLLRISRGVVLPALDERRLPFVLVYISPPPAAAQLSRRLILSPAPSKPTCNSETLTFRRPHHPPSRYLEDYSCSSAASSGSESQTPPAG